MMGGLNPVSVPAPDAAVQMLPAVDKLLALLLDPKAAAARVKALQERAPRRCREDHRTPTPGTSWLTARFPTRRSF